MAGENKILKSVKLNKEVYMFKRKAIKDFETWLSKHISCVSPLGELMVQKDGKWVNAFVEYLGGKHGK